MTTTLMRPLRLNLDSFARATGTHPEHIRRLVTLGLINAEQDTSGALWFTTADITQVGRIRRLRATFALNYASIGLICDLLDRIAALESTMQHRSRLWGDRSWTSPR
jgi:DNA-binding transcriptional MerR regulator